MPKTPDGDELDILVALVSHYEEARWPTPKAGRPADFLRDRGGVPADCLIGELQAA